MLTLRNSTGHKARRVLLTAAVVRTFRNYLKICYLVDLPPIGSAAEREALLMKRNVTKAGQPWEPG